MSRVVIFGPPGAGKGQQSEKLKQAGYHHVAVGDLLRAVTTDASHPLHDQVASVIHSGNLIDDNVILQIVETYLKQFSQKDKVLLDGFPRTVPQAKAMSALSIEPTCLIVLVVDRDVIIKRITGRWIDPPSGRVYHEEYAPPKQHGVDDISGRKLVQRKDDTTDVIEKRLNAYQQTTRPIVNYFELLSEKQQIKIAYVDGMQPIADVTATIKRIIGY